MKNLEQKQIKLQKGIFLTVWEPVEPGEDCFVNSMTREVERVFIDAVPFVAKYFPPRKNKKWTPRKHKDGKVKIYTKEEIRLYEEDLKNENSI